ncbi:patatin-like phospholipase-domain-containing protein [Staphylotrichum tortipilum]|uniref:Patatin-like phospholipase-domain-containing protein n=1 Tax=Staphylotrichum tortipilum TaxID=2831512 RepID=A0AAN6MRD2_9PEZI|nr:patatin-like phospholipase-domain-containing protein [Staphylotrichum longicolle]
MTDVASPPGERHRQIPGPPSALRSSRSKPKRVPTRVSIVAPRGSTPADADATISPRSVAGSVSASAARPALTPPGLRVASATWKRLILTLDGGGIRGYSSLVILRALMREIARLEQALEPCAAASTHTDRIPRDQIPDDVYRDGQYLPCHYFDYIAGTSVGGLIAIMLGMFGQSVDDCINEFHRQNKAIPVADDASVVSSIDFPLLYRRSTWPTKRTRSFFDTFAKFAVTATSRSLTGDSTTPSLSPASSQSSASSGEFRKDTYQCQTLAWCTEVEARRSRKPYAFCTYAEDDNESEDGRGGGSSSEPTISIPEVAKAITTPSRYSFKPFKLGSGQFVDGSKQVRDPTLQVMKEITSLLDETEPPIDLLLSFGTDEHQAWFYEKLRHFTLSQPATTPSPTPSTSTDHAAITSEHGRSYNHYTRLSVPNIKLGFRKKNFLREIEAATEAWLAQPDQIAAITQHARLLVERRRARAATARWESFALGVRYVCFHEGCVKKRKEGEGEGQVWTSRGDFFDHLERRHGLMRMKARGEVDVEGELDRGRRFGCT